MRKKSTSKSNSLLRTVVSPNNGFTRDISSGFTLAPNKETTTNSSNESSPKKMSAPTPKSTTKLPQKNAQVRVYYYYNKKSENIYGSPVAPRYLKNGDNHVLLGSTLFKYKGAKEE